MSPREPLTRDRIIEAALHIVDGQGLGRLTMRRLGDALEVEAMAIYHHLPRGKEELLDGLVTHVGVLHADTRPLGADDWRDRIRSWAEAYRALLVDHAGVLPLLVTRRNPAALATTARSIAEVLRLAGFLESAAHSAARTLLAFLIGHAALEVRGRELATPEPVDWDRQFEESLEVLLSGMLTALL
ncbi:TetR family transcriptional regulator [Actinocorallia herbida]|uniref:TetR family transcriptional regulator n=1 Tax=Actinocorallia herbida TaxID=58109 RepID=A0A3N1CTX9_9ACTN|nr:TetR/AcrR family transcriptional regulator [Actinocorallia herbida]ROO84634.1 TetR family transcriptional regulator [Actinocorallia herbida]